MIDAAILAAALVYGGLGWLAFAREHKRHGNTLRAHLRKTVEADDARRINEGLRAQLRPFQRVRGTDGKFVRGGE